VGDREKRNPPTPAKDHQEKRGGQKKKEGERGRRPETRSLLFRVDGHFAGGKEKKTVPEGKEMRGKRKKRGSRPPSR